MAARRPVKRSARRRPTKRTVLIVTNGRTTEKEYFERLRREYKKSDFALTVKVIEGEPDSLWSTFDQRFVKDNFDAVWFVIDADGHDRGGFIRNAQSRSSRTTPVCVAVSDPCFEVWLIAHYAQVRNYQDQRDAQRHWALLTRSEDGAKSLPRDFPITEFMPAVERSRLRGRALPARDVHPTPPGTGVPHLLMDLGLIDE